MADIIMQYKSPMGMLQLWKRSTEEEQVEIKNLYIEHFKNEPLLIDDIFDGIHKRRSKENQWHYWWRTIGMLEPDLRDLWLDKWLHTLAEARERRQISIEIELMDNTIYWTWPTDKEAFFINLATRLVNEFINTRVYNTDMTPFRFNTDFPGVGQAKMRWREYIIKLISETYPHPETTAAQSLHAKLWLVTSAFTFRQEQPNIDAAPDVPFFNKHPRVWFDIVANELTIQDAFKRIDLSAVMS